MIYDRHRPCTCQVLKDAVGVSYVSSQVSEERRLVEPHKLLERREKNRNKHVNGNTRRESHLGRSCFKGDPKQLYQSALSLGKEEDSCNERSFMHYRDCSIPRQYFNDMKSDMCTDTVFEDQRRLLVLSLLTVVAIEDLIYNSFLQDLKWMLMQRQRTDISRILKHLAHFKQYQRLPTRWHYEQIFARSRVAYSEKARSSTNAEDSIWRSTLAMTQIPIETIGIAQEFPLGGNKAFVDEVLIEVPVIGH
nr:hypothetical protein Iba_chr14fCG0660 [Ipomoea batatas]